MNEKKSFSYLEKNEKLKKWEETEKMVGIIIDKLGKPIDKNIKETVIVLHVLGINTTSSCEGHLDHGTYAPYIDIETKEILYLSEKLKEATKKEQVKEIIKEIENKNLEERKRIVAYLDEFYKKRKVPFNEQLMIKGLARGRSRLESQGADLQKIEFEEIKKKQLLQYQDEMREFTAFLKRKYLKE